MKKIRRWVLILAVIGLIVSIYLLVLSHKYRTQKFGYEEIMSDSKRAK